MEPAAAVLPPQTPDTAALDREVETVLEDLRPALGAIIDQLRPPVRRAIDLRRVLGLSQTVCWGIFSAVKATDLRAMTSLLPGSRGMQLFFDAAGVSGVPADVVQRGRAAFDRFEETVTRHAGSRAAFEALVSGLSTKDDPQEAQANLLKHKRSVFRGTSVLVGRQMRITCQTFILHPSTQPGAAPGLLDSVYIGGSIGLHRIRHDVPLQMRARFRYEADPGTPGADAGPQPLDPREARGGGIGLLREFCSQPIPEFRPVEKIGNAQVYELVTGSVGVSSEVTVFEGYIMRASASSGSEHGLARYVQVPCEAYIGDILVHHSLFLGSAPTDPDVRVYAAPTPADAGFRDSDLLPMTERAEYLGKGFYAARTTVIPRYEELLAHTMKLTGWNGDEFHVFRCRVDYPLLSSRIRMTLRC
jgi:hypothetical protein